MTADDLAAEVRVLREQAADEAHCRRVNAKDSRRMIEFIGLDEPEVVAARVKIEADPYVGGADFGSIVIAYVTRLRDEVRTLRAREQRVRDEVLWWLASEQASAGPLSATLGAMYGTQAWCAEGILAALDDPAEETS